MEATLCSSLLQGADSLFFAWKGTFKGQRTALWWSKDMIGRLSTSPITFLLYYPQCSFSAVMGVPAKVQLGDWAFPTSLICSAPIWSVELIDRTPLIKKGLLLLSFLCVSGAFPFRSGAVMLDPETRGRSETSPCRSPRLTLAEISGWHDDKILSILAEHGVSAEPGLPHSQWIDLLLVKLDQARDQAEQVIDHSSALRWTQLPLIRNSSLSKSDWHGSLRLNPSKSHYAWHILSAERAHNHNHHQLPALISYPAKFHTPSSSI